MADTGMFDGMSEEQLQELLGLSVNAQKMGLQNKQLDMANALRSQRYEGGGAGIGGAMGAMGSSLSNLAGALKAKQAMGGMDDLTKQRQAGLAGFAKSYFKGKKNDAAGSGYTSQPSGFGLGATEDDPLGNN